MVIHAPKEGDVKSSEELISKTLTSGRALLFKSLEQN